MTPYMVHDPWQMAGELLNGKWLIARWEDLGPDEDLATWTTVVRAVCETTGIDLMTVDLTRKSATLLFNGGLPSPTFAQIEESVAAIEYHRFTERQIGDKLSVLS